MTHAELIERAGRWLARSRRCYAVLTERGVGGEIPDAIGWRGSFSILVECKASREDFFADSKKLFRLHPELGMGFERWFMTSPRLVTREEVPDGWGLLEAYEKQTRIAKPWTRPAGDERHLRAIRAELSLVVSELSRYQSYGITYPNTNEIYGPWEAGELGRFAQQAIAWHLPDAAYVLAKEAAHKAIAGGWLKELG